MITYNQFEEIKEMYVWFEKEIFDRYSKTNNHSRWVDPYSTGIDFLHSYSPIEMMAWQVIRGYGHAPFYPQYPVGKYFLDFGNPIVKVGIECDGKEFHTDKEKDFKRDTELQELGWTIYRITGADCFRIVDELNESDGYSERDAFFSKATHFTETIEGLVESLGIMYFGQLSYGDPSLVTNLVCQCLSNRVSIHTQEFTEQLSKMVNDYYNKLDNLKH